jgi:hypothetical protein
MPYFLFVFAALAVAGLGCGLRRRSPQLGNGLILLGGLGALAVVGWQVRQTLFPSDERMATREHRAIGFCLAGQIQRAITGQRGTVVLLLPPTRALAGETADTYADSLRGPLLRGHPEWDLQVATLEASAKEAKAGQIPLAAFKRALAQSPSALAFVCYTSVPADFGTLFPSDKPATPVFVFDIQGTTNWVQPLVQRQLRSVVVPRPEPLATRTKALAEGLFNQFYYLVTPENATQVAAQLAAAPASKRR